MTIPGPFQPGDIIGGKWKVTGLIGEASTPGSECDAEHPSAYMMPDGGMACRCTVCPRCHHHTGNSHQGHYWAYCKVLAARLRATLAPGETLPAGQFMKRTMREFHFCCSDPAYGCELEVKALEEELCSPPPPSSRHASLSAPRP